ncbi:MAG: shikimate dehydrogenase [Candidatus Margulisiibacteriota bacterium]
MSLTGKTTVLGIFGNPIAHTASPAMHSAGFEALGLDYVYVPFLVDLAKIGDAVASIRTLNLRGVNVTIPFKEAVLPYLDHIDPDAKAIGAVNTIVNDNGQLTGYNTDAPGFCFALRQELTFAIEKKTTLLLGAGGSAKAIAYQLLKEGCSQLFLVNRNPQRATELADSLRQHFSASLAVLQPQNINEHLPNIDLIVNTTPLGMKPDDALPLETLTGIRQDAICCDIIYTPPKTAFLAQAETAGARILNGAGMLAAQGVLAFEKFTGHPIDYALFKSRLKG